MTNTNILVEQVKLPEQPIIPTERLERVRSELTKRVNDPAFDELASIFGAELPSDNPDARLDTLVGVARTYWDFRKGAERQNTNWDGPGAEELGQEGSPAWNAVFAAADKLDMVESSRPSRSSYDAVLVLGGANNAPEQRVRYAVEQGVKVNWMALLGSDRKLSQAEKEKTAWYAPGAETEFDLMCGAVESVHAGHVENAGTFTLHKTGYEHTDETVPRVTLYKRDDGTTIFVLNSPIPVGKPRAETAETYMHLREAAGKRLDDSTNVLLVTNALYVPFQHDDALTHLSLPTGANVETIGFSAEYGGVKRLPTQLLQEVKSHVDKLKGLSDVSQAATAVSQESEDQQPEDAASESTTEASSRTRLGQRASDIITEYGDKITPRNYQVSDYRDDIRQERRETDRAGTRSARALGRLMGRALRDTINRRG